MKTGTLMRLGLWRLAIVAGMGLAGNTWASQVQVVTLAGFVFNPVAVSVVPGQIVQWTNQDGVAHTVTSDPSNSVSGGPDSDTPFPSGFGAGGNYSWNVPSNAVSGTTWYYHCAIHGSAGNGSSLGAGMAGMITVIGNGGILLATNALVFSATYQGVNPAAQTFGLTNVGGSGFTYTNVIIYGAGASGWLTVLPAAGAVASNGATTLTNQVAIAGLGAGTYYATNQITAADASNSPQTVAVTLTVAKADQTIVFQAISSQTVSSVVHLSAAASSGLPVGFVVVSGPGMIRGGTNLLFTATGTISIVASQAGDSNWNAAPSMTNDFTLASFVTISSGICADYDGDGKADPAFYDETTGTWNAKLSSADYATIITMLNGLGGPGLASVSADYDGDGKADPAVYQESTGLWKILFSSAHYALFTMPQLLGGPGYNGMPADYDGDQKADPGVYRREQGDWKVLLSSAGYASLEIPGLLGGPGYRAVAADYDGDLKADPAVYGESTGLWSFLLSSAGYLPFVMTPSLGGSGYIPVPADYDGDGLADPAVKSETGNEWIVMLSSAGYAPVHVTLLFE